MDEFPHAKLKIKFNSPPYISNNDKLTKHKRYSSNKSIITLLASITNPSLHKCQEILTQVQERGYLKWVIHTLSSNLYNPSQSPNLLPC